MTSRALVLGLCVAATPAAAVADDAIPPVVGGRTYVQHQILAAKAGHPGVTAIVVEGKRDEDKTPVVLGSTQDAGRVFATVERPAPDHGMVRGHGGATIFAPFDSSSGHRIGTIAVTFAAGRALGARAMQATTHAIAAAMAKATLSAKNAADPYPYNAAFGPTTYAQRLTERTVAHHPDLLVMMIHATPPQGKQNVIIGSNIGRFGKAADEDDLRVIDKGETNLEVAGEKDRFETELPLNDASGKRIGALGLVFPYQDGRDKEAIHRHGLAIRDEIARQIPSDGALFRAAR